MVYLRADDFNQNLNILWENVSQIDDLTHRKFDRAAQFYIKICMKFVDEVGLIFLKYREKTSRDAKSFGHSGNPYKYSRDF